MFICSYLRTLFKEDYSLQFFSVRSNEYCTIVLSIRSCWKLSTTQRTDLSQQKQNHTSNVKNSCADDEENGHAASPCCTIQ